MTGPFRTHRLSCTSIRKRCVTQSVTSAFAAGEQETRVLPNGSVVAFRGTAITVTTWLPLSIPSSSAAYQRRAWACGWSHSSRVRCIARSAVSPLGRLRLTTLAAPSSRLSQTRLAHPPRHRTAVRPSASWPSTTPPRRGLSSRRTSSRSSSLTSLIFSLHPPSLKLRRMRSQTVGRRRTFR